MPEKQLGKKVFSLPHYGQDYNSEDHKSISLPQAWKEKKIEEFAQIGSGEKITPECDIVCGEMADTESIEKALNNGFFVRVVCGPIVLSEKMRQDYLKILEIYSNSIQFYIIKSIPIRYLTMFRIQERTHIFLEDDHEEYETYENALVIEDAMKDIADRFKKIFTGMIHQGKVATKDDIIRLRIYQSNDD